MRKKNKNYSEEFKLSVIRDYYSSGMSKYACIKKYGLSSPHLFLTWLRKYDSDEKVLPLQSLFRKHGNNASSEEREMGKSLTASSLGIPPGRERSKGTRL